MSKTCMCNDEFMGWQAHVPWSSYMGWNQAYWDMEIFTKDHVNPYDIRTRISVYPLKCGFV